MPRISYTTEDLYLSYLEYTSDNSLYTVDKAIFKAIISDYFKYLRDRLIEESRELKLPLKMGTLCVIKRRPKKFNSDSLRVDFKASRDMKKMILHLNEHSDGYNYRFYWNKSTMYVKNKTMYEFVMTRANKRRLAYIIKNKITDYIEY